MCQDAGGPLNGRRLLVSAFRLFDLAYVFDKAKSCALVLIELPTGSEVFFVEGPSDGAVFGWALVLGAEVCTNFGAGLTCVGLLDD